MKKTLALSVFLVINLVLAPAVNLVIVRDAVLEVGLIADAIAGVSSISIDCIQPPLPTLPDSRASASAARRTST